MNVYALTKFAEKYTEGCDKIVIISISAHVYNHDLKRAESETVPLECAPDTRGYFVITRVVTSGGSGDFTVKVDLMHNGLILQTFESDDIKTLFDSIAIHVSNIHHALYLGSELEKAFNRNISTYIQS
jgi:hypothetical protein